MKITAVITAAVSTTAIAPPEPAAAALYEPCHKMHASRLPPVLLYSQESSAEPDRIPMVNDSTLTTDSS